jgi:hypothetical protein
MSDTTTKTLVGTPDPEPQHDVYGTYITGTEWTATTNTTAAAATIAITSSCTPVWVQY